MNWYLKVLQQYSDFNGRARRKEYWLFTLFNLVFSAATIILDNVFGITIENFGYGPLYFVYGIIVFIPSIAVSVRRLHDVGKSGKMLFIGLIPLIGTVWLLILLLSDSSPGKNIYGENPKQDEDMEHTSNQSDLIIQLVVIWMFSNRLFWILVHQFSDHFYQQPWYKLSGKVVDFIWSIIPLTLAFAIKDEKKQKALYVLGGLYFAYSLYKLFG